MFLNAKPVWIAGKAEEMNVQAAIRTRVAACDALSLHIAGTVFYRVFANGKFLAAGPARAAEGYLREDILPIDGYAPGEELQIEIEAMGYNCGSLATVWQRPCLMAELRQEDTVLWHTCETTEAFLPGTRVQKVERYSVQRHFSEVWDFRDVKEIPAQLEIVPDVYTILNRKAPYPLYEVLSLHAAHRVGTFTFDETLPYKGKKYSWQSIPKYWGVFEDEEVVSRPTKWLQRQKQTVTGENKELPLTLREGEYAILDFGRIEAGFLTANMESQCESDVVIGFTELYLGEQFQFTQMNAHNTLEYLLPAGAFVTQCFEPYTFRYAIVMIKSGEITLRGFGALTYVSDLREVPALPYENETQAAIGKAAIRNLSHNALDIYMDCPSRERAGWLADGYFIAQAEYAMTGKTRIEDVFLENYRLFPNSQGELPKGALPETYPSDIPPGGTFIPQFDLWYILQVEQYIHHRGNAQKKEDFRKSVYGVLAFFRTYENGDGLVEGLPSWNFIEWSAANDWGQDVNYPTNFLYAAALEAAGRLYADEGLKRHAEAVRKATIAQSFNGKYFLDHSIRTEDGSLAIQEHASEVCQYYALLFGGIDADAPEYAYLKHLITDVFALDREGKMPEIIEINVFPGLFLRMDALLMLGQYDLALRTVEDFFGKMEPYTGTLWEYRQFKGSYDHGFSSVAYAVMKKAFEEKNK